MTDDAPPSLLGLKATLAKEIEKLTERMVGIDMAIAALQVSFPAKDARTMVGNGPIDQDSALWESSAAIPVKAAVEPRKPGPGRRKQPKEVRLDDRAEKAGRKRRDVRGEVLETLLALAEFGASDRDLSEALSSRGKTTVTLKQARDALAYHAKGKRVVNYETNKWRHADFAVVDTKKDETYSPVVSADPGELVPLPLNGPVAAPDLGRVIDALDEVGDHGLCDDDLWDHQISKAEIMKAVTVGVVEIREGRYYAVPG